VTRSAAAAWYIDVSDTQRDAELHFLKSEIYRRDINLLVRRIEASDRFPD
jgi:DNA polymerase-3 subunit epsilon